MGVKQGLQLLSIRNILQYYYTLYNYIQPLKLYNLQPSHKLSFQAQAFFFKALELFKENREFLFSLKTYIIELDFRKHIAII